jgi:hypothetical protein
MTDKEIEEFVEGMREHFGTLPNPEQEPRRFAYCIKLYKYHKERLCESQSSNQSSQPQS